MLTNPNFSPTFSMLSTNNRIVWRFPHGIGKSNRRLWFAMHLSDVGLANIFNRKRFTIRNIAKQNCNLKNLHSSRYIVKNSRRVQTDKINQPRKN